MTRPAKNTGTFADLTGAGEAFDAPDLGKPGRCGPDDCAGPGGGCPLCDATCVDRGKHWHSNRKHPPFVPAPYNPAVHGPKPPAEEE